MTARLAVCGLALAALFLAPAARAQDSAADYQASWLEAQSALAAFANAQLAQRRRQLDPGELLAAYRRESARYAAALERLGKKLPPPEAALAHWKMLPLHERALSAVRIVLAAAERGDEAALAAGWSTLADAVGALRRTAQEGQ
jgi:hypothetical protein